MTPKFREGDKVKIIQSRDISPEFQGLSATIKSISESSFSRREWGIRYEIYTSPKGFSPNSVFHVDEHFLVMADGLSEEQRALKAYMASLTEEQKVLL